MGWHAECSPAFVPSSQAILRGLTDIAQQRGLAVAWHLVLWMVLGALTFGVRPSKRAAMMALVAPLVSVAVLAVVFGNPFNALVFGVGSIALVATALSASEGPVRRAPSLQAMGGGLLIAFGAVYPHFLPPGTTLEYLYAAPTGLVPCPTLSVVIGVTLIGGGFASRVWSLLLALLGLFYGLFGVLQLGVVIDLALAAGALGLFASEITSAPRRALVK